MFILKSLYVHINRETVEVYTTGISKVSEEILANLSLLRGMEQNGLRDLH